MLEKYKNKFCNKDFKDFTEYRYDITNYMKELMGDFVSSAYAQLGFVFKTDDENEQDRDIRKIYSLAEDIDNMYEKESQLSINNNITLFVFFNNGKSVKFSTIDFAVFGKIE